MIALVTGGGRGIGANIARKLAEEGWQVVVAASTGAQVEAVADEIGGRASSYSGIISPALAGTAADGSADRTAATVLQARAVSSTNPRRTSSRP